MALNLKALTDAVNALEAAFSATAGDRAALTQAQADLAAANAKIAELTAAEATDQATIDGLVSAINAALPPAPTPPTP